MNIGSVHGRFQPLHLGHEEYLFEAKKNCDILYIGVTQVIPQSLSLSHDKHRFEKRNNPLTFFERMRVIQAFIDANNFHNCFIIPFPIETPEYLENYLAKNITCFTTIMDEWNINKINLLKAQGYHVVSLWDRRGEERPHSGAMIRTLCLAGGLEAIKSHVSPAVYKMLNLIDFNEKLSLANLS